MHSAVLSHGVTDHTCHHPRRVSDLVTKSEKWNGKLRVACVNVQRPPLQNAVAVLPRARWSEGEGHSRDWREKQL